MSNKFVKPISCKSFTGDGTNATFFFDKIQATVPFAAGQPITVTRMSPDNFNGYFEVVNCDYTKVEYACTATIPTTQTINQYSYDEGTDTITAYFSTPMLPPYFQTGVRTLLNFTSADDVVFNGSWVVTTADDTTVQLFIDTGNFPSSIPLKSCTGNVSVRITNGSVRTYVPPPVLNVTGASGDGVIARVTFAEQRIAPYTPGQAFSVTGVSPNGYNGNGLVCVACDTVSLTYNSTTGVGGYNNSGKITPSLVAPNTYPVVNVVSVSNLINKYVDWGFTDGTFGDTNCPFVEGQNMYANVVVTYLGRQYPYVNSYEVQHINQRHDGFGVLYHAPGWISTNNTYGDNGIVLQTASGYCSPETPIPPPAAWKQFAGYNVSNTLHTVGANYQLNDGVAQTISNTGHIGMYGAVNANSVTQANNPVTAGSGDQTLDYTSNATQVVSNSSLRSLDDSIVTQNILLPDATTLVTGAIYPIINNATDAVTVKDSTGTFLGSVPNGLYTEYVLTNNTTAGGTWQALTPGYTPDTFSSLTVAGDTTGASNAPLLVSNSDAHPTKLINMLAPNLTTTESTAVSMGHDLGTGNALKVSYTYVANNDNGNTYGFGFEGESPDIYVTNLHEIHLTGATYCNAFKVASTYNVTLDSSNATSNYSWRYPPGPGTSGQVLSSTGSGTAWVAPSTGTVTSVGLTASTPFSVTGSPVTTSGSFALDLNNPTGSGSQLVLANGPTLNGVTVTAATAAYTFGPLTVNNTYTSPGAVAVFSAPNLNTNDSVQINMGRTITAGNAIANILTYHGDNDPTNTYSFGFFGGSPDIVVTNNGTMALTNVTATSLKGNTVAVQSTHLVTLDASNATGDYTFKFPPTAGTSGQLLSTTGSGTAWTSAGTGSVTSIGLTASTPFLVTGSPVTTSGSFALDLNSPTGTGSQLVLANGPTLNGVTVTAATAAYTYAPLTVSNTYTSPGAVAVFSAPNLNTNDSVQTNMGRTITTGNAVANVLTYHGDNDPTNTYSFGFFGSSPDIVATNNGTLQLASTLKAITVADSTASYTNAPLNVQNTYTSPGAVAVFSAPNLNTNDSVQINMGRTITTGNAIANVLTYKGNNDPTNTYSMGFFGATPDLVATNNGTVKFNSTLKTTNLSDSTSSFSAGVLNVTNTNAGPGSLSVLLAPNMSTGQQTSLTMGQGASTGNSAQLNLYYNGNNDAGSVYGLSYYGKGNDIAVKNDKSITIGQDTSSPTTCLGSFTALNYVTGSGNLSCYGWNGSSVQNPNTGPYNVPFNYSRTGNVVTVEFVAAGTYTSVATGSSPYLSGFPNFGKTIGAFAGVVDCYASNFTGQALPYVATIGTGGASGHDMTFTYGGGASLLGFQVTGGAFLLGGIFQYYLV